MPYKTFRYKIEGSLAQYAALRSARFHCKEFRNACLQERIESYRTARNHALIAGRDRPSPQDWVAAHGAHAPVFLAWQDSKRSDLIRRHDQAQQRLIAKAMKAFEDGITYGPVNLRPLPWRARTADDLNRAISKQDQFRSISEIRLSDPGGIGKVPTSVLREHAIIVDEAMQGFFKRVGKGETPGFPRFKGFDQVKSLECPFGDGIGFERYAISDSGEITSCRLKSMMWAGGLKVRMHRPLPGRPRRVQLKYDGRFWWVCFLIEVELPHRPHHAIGTVAGCDVGVNRLVTLDDGSHYENPRFLRVGANAIANAQRRLAVCKRASNARRKAKRALATAHRRVRNRRNTWMHAVAKRLAQRAETLVFEDLRLRNMMKSASGTIEKPGVNVSQKRGLNRALSDASLAALVETVRHKAESAGGRVLLVDPRNSSLECSCCHAIVVKQVYDLHDCPHCGLRLHRDHNSGIVLRDRGLAVLGPAHRPRRGACSTGPKEAAGRNRPPGPEKTGTLPAANRAASGQSA